VERNSHKILARLKQDGWLVVSIEGSHHKLAHRIHEHKIVIVHPKKDLPIGTARQIHKAAGWL
jgi:predicted RNA binding protein YcfA (HicA-like mRNA interferase family)